MAGGNASSNCYFAFVTGHCHDFRGHPHHLKKYEEKTGGLRTCSPHRRCLYHWPPETGEYSLCTGKIIEILEDI